MIQSRYFRTGLYPWLFMPSIIQRVAPLLVRLYRDRSRDSIL